MSLNRLTPLSILRLPPRAILRQFSASRTVQNSENEAPTTENEPVEITESHRRDVVVDPSKPRSKQTGRQRPNLRTQSSTDDSQTDFFDSPVSATPAARIAKYGGVEISTDMLTEDENARVQRKAKGGVGAREGRNEPRRQGQGQGGQRTGQRGGRPQGQGRDASASGSRGPGQGQRKRDGPVKEGRERREDGRAVAPNSQPIEKPTSTFDTSFAGLFGAASLVSPARRGARDVGSSFWAKDMEAPTARKADLMRLAGSYDLRLPTTPHPSVLKSSVSAPERAKATARWAFASNPTLPLRARDPGVGVVDRLLR